MPKLCGAWCHGRKKRCTRPPQPGNRRCYYHGGASTGPRTPEGKQRSIAALWAGHAAYLARIKFLGQKRPGGRRPGLGQITKNMWAKRIADAFNVSLEDAMPLATELWEHLKEREHEERTLEQMLADAKAAGYINKAKI